MYRRMVSVTVMCMKGDTVAHTHTYAHTHTHSRFLALSLPSLSLTFTAHADGIWGAAWMQDTIVTGSVDDTVKVWRWGAGADSTLTHTATLKGHHLGVISVDVNQSATGTQYVCICICMCVLFLLLLLLLFGEGKVSVETRCIGFVAGANTCDLHRLLMMSPLLLCRYSCRLELTG